MPLPASDDNTLAMRSYAAACYTTAGSGAAAAALFTARYGPGAVARPSRFCKKWGTRLQQTGSVEDAYRCGPAHKVSDAAARQASKAFKAGAGSGDAVDGYSSIEQACTSNATLQAALAEAGCTARTLLRRMRQVDPYLVRRVLRIRPPLSAVNQAKRLQLARLHLQRWHNNPTYFRRVIWLDAKKIYVGAPKGRAIWCDSRRGGNWLVATHPALSSSGGASVNIRLEYYAAVNAELGAVDMVWCSTTTGMKRKFKASSAARLPSHVKPRLPATRTCWSWLFVGRPLD